MYVDQIALLGISNIFTARKRSLGQGNIFRSVCQEFCSQGGYLGKYTPRQVHPLAGTPLGRYTHLGQVHPPGRYTPWVGTHPWARYTPQAGTPPRQVHPLGRYTPPGQLHPPILLEYVLVFI